MILGLYHSLQKNKVLLVLLASVNKQTKPNEAFKEIGTCSKAINNRSIDIDDGFEFNEFLFWKVNLFKEV